MCFQRPSWTIGPALAGVLAVGVCIVGPLARSAAQAQDPVEELRAALFVKDPFILEADEAALKARQEALFKAVDNLKTVEEMRRALGLSDWKEIETKLYPKSTRIEYEARNRIGARFKGIIEEIIAKGDPVYMMAVSAMIGEIGANIRSLQSEDRHGLARELSPYLISMTTNKDPLVRQAAARALGKANPEPETAVKALRAMLVDSKLTDDRRAVSEALAEMIRNVFTLKKKGGASIGVLIHRSDVFATIVAIGPAVGICLRDPDAFVRRRGLDSVMQAGSAIFELVDSPAGTPAPQAGLMPQWQKDANLAEAEELKSLRSAAHALKELAEPLAATVTDSNTDVRVAARRALDKLAAARQRLMQFESSLPNAPAAKNAGQEPEDDLALAVRPSLLVIARKATDPDIRVRRATLDFLESLEEAAAPAVATLLVALTDKDRFIRWAAVRTLGKVGPVHADMTVPVISQLVNTTEDSDVREAAAITLKRYGQAGRAALPDLIAGLSKGDAPALEAIIRAIVSVGGPDVGVAVPSLRTKLRSEVISIRRTAAEALGQIGAMAVGAVPDLQMLLADDDPGVRSAASEALVNIARSK
jgi:HEAT repeat protein